MRIKFLKGDPRAGMVAEVEGERAKQLIAQGAAEEVGANVSATPATPSVEQTAVVKAAKKSAAKKAK